MRLFSRMLVFLGGLLLAPALHAQERIVAIGDLHGDYEAYQDIVEAAGIADGKGRWTGGDTVLVQLGDIADRGPDSLKIYQAVQKLEKDAAKAGGKVVVLLGNHEAMNVTGDLRYVSAGEYDAFKDRNSEALRERVFEANKEGIIAFYRRTEPDIPEDAAKAKWFESQPLGKFEHRAAWAPNGDVGAWIIEKPALVKLGDTVFVHGGLSVETAARPLETVNAEIRTELAKGESEADSILTDELGPLWYRGNIQRDPPPAPPADGSPPPPPARPAIADELTQVLSAYGARRLVIAHTPNPKGIVASADGRLVRIDTAISSAYGGVHSYLEIRGDAATAHRKGDDGTWSSTALPSPQGAAGQ